MNKVVIESPYAGDTVRNLRYARLCLLDSLARGESPLASHLLYPQVLDDNNPDERKLGIAAGLEWLKAHDVFHVLYCDLKLSPGMLAAREAMRSQYPFKTTIYRRLWPRWEVIGSAEDAHTLVGNMASLAFSDFEFDRLCTLEENKHKGEDHEP